jgi:putative tryptophan/tyrosine transport system substrate-binding protein
MRQVKALLKLLIGDWLPVWCALFLVVPPGAQSAGVRIGVLTPGSTFAPVFDGVKQGLTRLGYKEGENTTFIVEDTRGSVPDLDARAAKLAEAKPDVIVTVGTSHTAAAKKASSSLPIIFALVGDPLRSGFIASYQSSGNNLTGVTNAAGRLSGKRLEVLKETAPHVKRVLAIVAIKESIAEVSYESLKETARKLGVQVLRENAVDRKEIEKILLAMTPGTVDAIYHVPSVLMGANIDLLITKALEDRLPLIVHEDSFVRKGALVSYGAEFRRIGAQSARLIAKVLSGVKPWHLPTERPAHLVLSVNITTAKAIGLKISRSIMERAEIVIE